MLIKESKDRISGMLCQKNKMKGRRKLHTQKKKEGENP